METVEAGRALPGNPEGLPPPDSPKPAEVKPATALRHRDLLGIADLTAEEIVKVMLSDLDGAEKVLIVELVKGVEGVQ